MHSIWHIATVKGLFDIPQVMGCIPQVENHGTRLHNKLLGLPLSFLGPGSLLIPSFHPRTKFLLKMFSFVIMNFWWCRKCPYEGGVEGMFWSLWCQQIQNVLGFWCQYLEVGSSYFHVSSKIFQLKETAFSLRESVYCQDRMRAVGYHFSIGVSMSTPPTSWSSSGADTMEQQGCLQWILRSKFSWGQVSKCWAHRQVLRCQYDFIFILTTSPSLWTIFSEDTVMNHLEACPYCPPLQTCINMHTCHGVCVCAYTCVHAYMHQSVCGGYRTVFKSWCFPCTTWGPGMELRLAGLAASAFTHRAVSPAQASP